MGVTDDHMIAQCAAFEHNIIYPRARKTKEGDFSTAWGWSVFQKPVRKQSIPLPGVQTVSGVFLQKKISFQPMGIPFPARAGKTMCFQDSPIACKHNIEHCEMDDILIVTVRVRFNVNNNDHSRASNLLYSFLYLAGIPILDSLANSSFQTSTVVVDAEGKVSAIISKC